MTVTTRQQFPLRSLIEKTGGRAFFIRRTKVPREAAEKYLTDSKSPKAAAVAAALLDGITADAAERRRRTDPTV